MTLPVEPCQPAAQPLRTALERAGLFTEHQAASRRWAIGCVSLEVTQRCNLDCSLCYLSEHSEAVQDYPLEEIYRRIDMIFAHYGKDCDVQVSGGDPTLRDHDELEQIVRHIVAKGMRASLFTNGILASRALLQRLALAGLTDVAFHVDMTQERIGYNNETDLNALRLEYIARARGLGVSVFFNTTVFDGNVQDVPMLARFFAQHSSAVSLASFQMQADTGRGLLRERPGALTQQRMMQLLEHGAGTPLNWDALLGGHPSCNRYAVALVLGKGLSVRLFDLFQDGRFIARAMRETAHISVPRQSMWKSAFTLAAAVAQRPGLAWSGVRWLGALTWRLRGHWLAALQGGPRKISFFIHNFMDEKDLDPERIATCVFMAAGPEGPVPMCEFNAQRDNYLLQPLALADGSTWQPLRQLGGAPENSAQHAVKHVKSPAVSHVASRVVNHVVNHVVKADAQGLVHFPIKYLKGRSRQNAMTLRKHARANDTKKETP